MLGTPTRFRAQHLGLVDQWKNPFKKNGSTGGNIIPEASHVLLLVFFQDSPCRNHLWWIHRFRRFLGKSSTPIPTWKSEVSTSFWDLCDLNICWNECFIFTIGFIKTNLITNSSLQRLMLRKNIRFHNKKIQSSFEQKNMFGHFWRNALSPFLTT